MTGLALLALQSCDLLKMVSAVICRFLLPFLITHAADVVQVSETAALTLAMLLRPLT